MKKLIILTVAMLLMTTGGFAKDGDIPKVEVKPDVANYVLDTMRILFITSTAEVTYRKVDSSGDPIGEEVRVIFMDVADDPDTVEDETSTDFTDFLSDIGIKNKVIGDKSKVKLGI